MPVNNSAATVTLTGSAVFTTDYACFGSNLTDTSTFGFTIISGSQFTITGTNGIRGDTLFYTCL
jgi:hypothetical protein